MIKERNLALDLARIIAVFMVVMIHVSINYVSTFDTSTPEFIVGNILNSIVRAGVPLFVMVSGALMLYEDMLLNF